MGGEDSEIVDQMAVGMRNNRGNPPEELDGREQEVRGSVLPCLLQTETQRAVRELGETLQGERWPRDVARKALPPVLVVRADGLPRVQIVVLM